MTDQSKPTEDTHTVVLSARANEQVQQSETSLPTADEEQVSCKPYDGNLILERTIASLIAIVLTGGTMGLSLIAASDASPLTVDRTPLVARADAVAPTEPNPYETLHLEAQAYVVYDVHHETVLHAVNADDRRSLASLTKLMTALVAYENSNVDNHIAIAPFAIETEGDSGLFANETWRLRDLLGFLLMTSSNDGADAVATVVGSFINPQAQTTPAYKHVTSFVDEMNDTADTIGLRNTKYRNATGLDEAPGIHGGEGTANDMALLLSYTWQRAPELLKDTTLDARHYTSTDGFVHPSVNTNQSVGNVPGLLGGKTGYTDEAGGNLAVIYDAGMNHPIVVVVLGSSIDGRFADVEALVDATYEYVASGWYEYEVAGSTPRA